MKHGKENLIHIEEISAMRILRELREKALKDNDGKVHIREIENDHIGKTIEKY